MNNPFKKFFLNINGNRTKKIKVNIFFSIIFKGVTIIISLVLVPIALNYLGKEKYGVWVTISALANWLVYFDFGAGNGLRNKLSEALSKNNLLKAKQLISTTYFIVGLSFSGLFVVLYIISRFINWNKFLNISVISNENLDFIVIAVLGLFFLRFVLQLVKNVFYAYQYPSFNDLIALVGQALVLILFLIISKNNNYALTKASIVYVGAPLIILLISSIIFYAYKSEIRPGINSVNFSLASGLLKLGGGFMLLQASAVFLKTTTPVLISHFLNPALTAEYSISLKYFNIATIVSTIIFRPFWSAVTEAFVKKDFQWIRINFYKNQLIAFGFAIIVVLLIIVFPFVFRLWLPNFLISKEVLYLSSLFVITFIITNPIIIFINGTGHIKEQMFFSVLIITTILPLDILLFYYFNFGLASFIIPPIVLRLARAIRGYYQLKKLVLLKN